MRARTAQRGSGAGAGMQAPGRAWFGILIAALLCGAALLLYLPVLSPSPVIDDGTAVFDHPAVRGTQSWLTAPFYAGTFRPLWRPLTTLTFAWNWQAFRSDKRAYAVVNLLILVAVSIAAYFLLRRLGAGRVISALAAGFLLAHAGNAESVMRLAGRSELLARLLMLLALLVYLGRGARDASSFTARRSTGPLWVWVTLFVLALLSHESALLLPLILLGYELTVGAREAVADRRRLVLSLGAAVVIALAWVAVHEGVIASWPDALRKDPAPDYVAALSGGERLRLAAYLPALYARTAIWSRALLPDYAQLLARPAEAPPVVFGDAHTFGVVTPDSTMVVQGGAVLALAIAIFLLGRRRAPLLAFGGWLLAITLLAPLPLLRSNGHVASGRHLFPIALALAILVVALLRMLAARGARLRRYAGASAAAAAALLILSAVQTRSMARTWRTHDDVLARLAAQAPLSPEVPTQRAAAALRRANTLQKAGESGMADSLRDEAIALYEESVGLFPREPRVLFNLGLLRAERDRPSMARRVLTDAAIVAKHTFPGSSLGARIYLALGMLHAQQGLPDDALAAFFGALEIDSTNVQALAHAGMIEIRHARSARLGVRHLDQALQLDRDKGALGPLAGRVREMKSLAESNLGLVDQGGGAYDRAMESASPGRAMPDANPPRE